MYTVGMTTVVEGQWTYTREGFTVTATNGTQTLTANTLVDARRLVFEATVNPRYTVVSGPGRALSARRYTQSYERSL